MFITIVPIATSNHSKSLVKKYPKKQKKATAIDNMFAINNSVFMVKI